jgi:3-oxoacyl-(acyl-carrier-protein) synthase
MSENRANEIAIVGMACVYPGAENFHRFWENIVQKVNAIGEPPPDWEADLFWDPHSKTIDRTYCKRGGWLGKLASFDPFSLGIMPAAIDGAEPDHFMALQTAHDALQDAQVKNLEEVKHRTAVIIGRGTYINRGNAAALQQSVIVESVIRIIRQLHPEHTEEELALIKKELQKTAPPFHADTAPGLVPNIITGRICNRLDLMGPNYLIDAACASSLVAVEMACRELRNGQCDLALAGGVHTNTSPVLMMIFSNLGALSRKGEMRPFDEGADGTLLGEGVGMVVLKRLADAEQAGDAERHVRVAGEVEVDLRREEVDRDEHGDAPVPRDVAEDGVDERRQAIGDDQLLEHAPQQELHAHRRVRRGRARAVGELRQQVLGALDGALDEAREEGEVERVAAEVPLRRESAVAHVDQVRDRLQHVVRHAERGERASDAQRRAQAEQDGRRVQALGEGGGVAQADERGETRRDAEPEEEPPSRRVRGALQPPRAGPGGDRDRRQHHEQVRHAAQGVERVARDEEDEPAVARPAREGRRQRRDEEPREVGRGERHRAAAGAGVVGAVRPLSGPSCRGAPAAGPRS